MSDRKEVDTGEYDLEEIRRHLTARRGAVAAPGLEPVSVVFGAATHRGHVRANNEDHYVVGRLNRTADVLMTNLPGGYVPERFEQSAYAFAVADGMGGAAAGEVASALALSVGTSLTMDASRWQLDLDARAASRLAEHVNEFFEMIDHALAERARQDPSLAGMGTTLTVAYTVGFEALIFHIGDSRAYLWRGGTIDQVTRDETLAQAMADSGAIDSREVAAHPMRHVLTRAIGACTGHSNAVVSPLRLQPDDRLLLCTDGLSDLVSDRRVGEILAAHDEPQAACDALIAAALAAGGHDNVTVVLAHFSS
jgi:protein phosphatase